MFEILGLGAEFTFDAQGTERISDIVGRLQSLSNQMSLSTADTRRYSNTLTEFGNIVTDMGKQLMVAGGATTAAAMYGVSKAAEWQSQMVDAVRYMSDDSVEAQTAYNKTLKETAQLLGRTKEEINASAVSYMMMGKSTEDALRLTKNAGYAAVAWDMTADSVADSFRTIKAAFNVNLEDQDMYQKYLDTINEVGNSTAATSKDVVAFLADGGSALHNVANVSIEQAMGMASAARYANMSIAEFSTMMIRLGNQYAQDKSTEYFSKLGVEVKEADGSMRSFADVLYDVQKQWNNLDQATRSEFASGVGGVYADRLSLYMGSGEEYAKGAQIAQQDNTGSAEAEFNRVTDTYEMAMARFKVTLSDFGTAFWGTLLPPLTKFINLINNVVTAFSNFAQDHPIVMKLVASVILLGGVLTTLAGAGLVVAGMFAKLRASQVLGHFATLRTTILSRGLGVVFRGLFQSMGPTIARFGKLAGVMGTLYIAWKYDILNIRSMFEDFTSKMKLSLETSKKLLDNSLSLDDFKRQIQDLNQSNSVWDKITLGITKVGLALKGLGQYMKQGFLDDDMFSKLNAMGLMPMISIIIGLGMRLKALWNGIKEGFSSAIDWINEKVRGVFGPAFTWLHDHVLLPVAKAILGVDENVTDLGDAIDGIQFVDLDKMFGPIENWENFGKVIGGLAAAFMTLKTVSTVVGVISKVISIIGSIGSAIGTVAGWIGSALSGLVSFLGSAFSGVGSLLSGIGNAVMWVLGAIGSVVTAILGFFGIVVSLPAWVVGLITVAVVAIIGLIIHFRDEIWNFLTVTLPNAIGIAIDWIVNFFTVTIPNALQTAGEWLYNLFTVTIPNAVGYAIGWLVGNLYIFFTETLPGWVDTAVTAIGNFFTETLPEVIGNAIDAIGTFFTETLPQFVGDAIDAIGNFFTVTLPEAIQTGFDAVVQFITVDVPAFFESLPEKLMEIGENIVNGFLDGLNAAWTAVTEAVSNFVDGFIQGFKDALGIHSPSTVMSEMGTNTIQGFIDGISGMVGAVGEAIGNVVNTVTETVGGWIDSAVEWGSGLVDNISSGINSAASWVGDRANDVGNFFKNGWDTITGTASEWGSSAINNISSGISSARSFIDSAISNVANGAKSVWDSVKNSAPEWGQTLMSNVESGISGASSLVTTAVSNITTNIQTTWNSIKDKAHGIASNMMTQYKQGIDSGKGPVSSAISAIGSTISSGLNSLKDSALSWGSNLVDGFASGIRNAAGKAASAASSVVNSVKNFLGFNSPAKMGEGRHIVEWGYNMVSGFADGIVSAEDMLSNTMANVITNPVKDAMNGVGEMPISASLTQNGTISPDSNLTGYLGQIITLLSVIAEAKASIISGQTESNGSLSQEPMQQIRERVERTENAITENNAHEVSVNIDKGAIENHFHIDGSNGVNKEELMELMAMMLDENLMPLLMDKIRELKVALNE